MTVNEIIEQLNNLHSKILRSPFSKNVTESEIMALIESKKAIEEFKSLKEKNEEVEIPEPQGNEIVAGIILPKVKGKAVVSLSDLHDILMDVGGINIRDKVFEQIYDRGVIIGLRDVIEKWEERRKNAEHEDCALSCEEIRNKDIDEFVNTLMPRLTDAIYQKDVESMTNLINDFARELKAGGENE